MYLSRYIPVRPTVPQAAFMLLPQHEAFYGGAAGGGKSTVGLMLNLQYSDQKYASMIIRRTRAEFSLPGGLLGRSQEWLAGTDAHWDGINFMWRFPSGAQMVFGYLDSEKDLQRYGGTEFDLIHFDEITAHPQRHYQFMHSRIRRAADGKIAGRMRATGMPGGIGHEWVQQYFIDGAGPERPFIPAKIEDNPHLDQPSYIASLSHLDPITRQQLLKGDWSARITGGLFRREWVKVVTERPEWLVRCVRYWDLAATPQRADKSHDPDYTVGTLAGIDREKRVWILDVVRVRRTPEEVKALMRSTAEADRASLSCAYRVHWEEEGGASGKFASSDIGKVLMGMSYQPRRKRAGQDKFTEYQPFSSACEAGRVGVVAGRWLADWLLEQEAFPGGGHDDQCDSASGAFAMLTAGGESTIVAWKPRAERG